MKSSRFLSLHGFGARALAFTLVELLIVVAIIAILAAIAIPNLLHAQIRSKVARVKADMRTLAGALEAYHTDQNSYPLCNEFGLAGARVSVPDHFAVLERLSTPVAYLTNAFPPSPFPSERFSGPFINGSEAVDTGWKDWPLWPVGSPDDEANRSYHYYATNEDSSNVSGIRRDNVDEPETRKPATAYILQSSGPMMAHINMGGVIAQATEAYSIQIIYDPTNGTTSFGNIFRVGGQRYATNNFYTAAINKE